MFVEAKELRSSLTRTIDSASQSVGDVMDYKLKESKADTGHGSGVYGSVQRKGVLNPVQLVHGTEGSLLLGHGHHRVAAAADISETTGKDKWIPVVHTDASEKSNYPVSATGSATYHKMKALDDYGRFSRATGGNKEDAAWAVAQSPPSKRRKLWGRR
jgi:hypothetical protein